jgi:hypothetical protein
MSVPARPNYPTPEELVSWYLDPPFLAQNDPGPASVAVG